MKEKNRLVVGIASWADTFPDWILAGVREERLFLGIASMINPEVEKVGDAEVVRLRGTLLPLIRLADVIGVDRTYEDIDSNEIQKDRRTNIADRRSKKSPLIKDDSSKSEDNIHIDEHNAGQRSTGERSERDRRRTVMKKTASGQRA